MDEESGLDVVFDVLDSEEGFVAGTVPSSR